MLSWCDRPGGQKVGVTAEVSLHRNRAGSVCYLWLRGDFPLPLRQLQPSNQTTVSRQLTHHLLYWGIAMIVCRCAAPTGSSHFTPAHTLRRPGYHSGYTRGHRIHTRASMSSDQRRSSQLCLRSKAAPLLAVNTRGRGQEAKHVSTMLSNHMGGRIVRRMRCR